MVKPSERRKLEIEFHKWAKANGLPADVFNVIGWLQQQGLLLSDTKREILVCLRNDFRSQGWMSTAARIDEVLGE